MGEVYRGVDVGWGGIERPVAVKLIAPGLARDPEFVTTFVDEAKLSYLLCHANVVQVRDFGRTDETYFIAMEWVEGGDLGALLDRLKKRAGSPPPPGAAGMPICHAVLVAVEAARGLDYAHRLRDAEGHDLHVVHRDISPANLLVSFEGEVKISDFGIARSRMRQATSMPGLLKGKIGYLAPEQARGDPVDLRADVFALGVVLYEMLTGQNPFAAGNTEREALERLRTGTFRPPSALVPTLPTGLEAIVMRALASDREARYAGAGAMREDLEAFARREGYVLSPADLGLFVRELWSAPAPSADGAATAPGRPARRTPPAAEQPNTAPGWAGAAPRTVAVPAVSPTPDETPSASSPVDGGPHAEDPLEHPDEVPRAYPPILPWLVGGATVLGLVVSGAVALRGGRGEVLPPVIATPAKGAPQPAAVDRALAHRPGAVERPAVAVEAREPRPRAVEHAQAPARLSVASDVTANVFVDGEFVHETPVTDLPVAPGRHVVRLESSVAGSRLIPKEEAITLRAGETRRLTVELK
jgi:hypothetical protein